jgi:2-polyprenyl-6-methoxyphenol hydroxylase-like FAD-dependent oxidoreductase
MGLTLHQIGVPFHIHETVQSLRPLGVGINLQPPAVRELYALGLEDILETVGVQTRDYGFYTRTGLEIWTEPRGRHAGHNWPQYSVHRGRLQVALLDTLIKRCGPECISLGSRLRSYTTTGDTVTATLSTGGTVQEVAGKLLIGADGIHSAVRAQMYPNEGPPIWGGAIMWRGTTRAQPFLSGQSMILAGNDHIRFVAYPISAADEQGGDATINWIAERRVDPSSSVETADWNKKVRSDQFSANFADWAFDWISVPDLIARADAIFEYPMVDRDPVDCWTDGRATLIGDAAHATYPVGSSGASQAILDARLLGAAIKRHGASERAARAYEADVRPRANRITLANRSGGGPDAIMQIAEDRCAGDFSVLDRVLPMAERAEHAAAFKRLAGIGPQETNAGPSLID